jgi:predicted nuclease of predicted toxin-antitoxin system
VLQLALKEQRVLLTEDKDFGQLVFAAGAPASSVIFIRFPANARTLLPQTILDLVTAEQDRLVGAFVVVQPSRIRMTRSPTSTA